tara:strand:+ start:1054 stop:1203 length:150 start_codon:yes stop_codon:yes gene_type:complete
VGEEGGGVCSNGVGMIKGAFLPDNKILIGRTFYISTPGSPVHQELFLAH